MSENNSTNITVLIIDDDSQIRNYIRSTLVQLDGVDIINSANANDGIEKYKRFNPDIVFLDINLPYKDGLSLLREILELNKSANIIMISGDSTFDNVKTSIANGAKGFVVKPFTMKKILDSVTNIVSVK